MSKYFKGLLFVLFPKKEHLQISHSNNYTVMIFVAKAIHIEIFFTTAQIFSTIIIVKIELQYI